MKRYISIALVAAMAVAGCKDNPTSPPIDAPTVDALNSLTRKTLQQLAIGVTAQDRAAFAQTTGLLILAPILARDVFRIDASEPRYVLETLGGNADPGSFAGGSAWTPYYTAIRSANTVLIALRNAPSAEFTAAEVAASRGFFRTMKALDYYRLVEGRDTVGVAIQTDNPFEVTPIRCKPAVLTMIAALLDSANADFTAAGGATKLPFALPTGFSAFGRDYNVVSNLILFNRGLKGKVSLYQALQNRAAPSVTLAQQAVAELTIALGGAAPGAVPASQMDDGIYYKFDPVVDQQANPRSDDKIGLNPKVRDSIEVGDTRASKIVNRAQTITGNGISTSITFVGAVPTAANQSAPIALLKDEELVLLRAQAYIEAGQLDNARLDINSVRQMYGLLPHLAFANRREAIDAVLYEKRYSLLFEGPQRLVDLRAYGFLNEATLGTAAKELPSDPFNSAFPIPRAELNARGATTGVACQ